MRDEGADARFFATVERVLDHGGKQWWLYLSRCNECGQDWMIAQDERIFDEYLIKRLGRSTADKIISNGLWPDDFITYERVLRTIGERCQFPVWFDLNDSPLAYTIVELREANPSLTLVEAASLVGVSVNNLKSLKF